jgi:D-alanine-D-alanine ligase
MYMKNIAVICGGDSGEYEVSLNSADMVIKSMDLKKYRPYKILVKGMDWHLLEGKKKYAIDKNNFTCTIGTKKLKFDCVYNIIHGTPGEDGKMQGYLDMVGLPYTSPNVAVSGLTMNKYLTKRICSAEKLPVAKSVLVKETDAIINVDKIVKKLKLPCFVKPNNGGSSVATNKVYEKQKMVAAIEEAFAHDHEVIIEEFLKGTEVTCGVFYDGEKVQTLPITEIVPHNDFFDYDAKYNGQSDEITPARLEKKIYKKVQKLTAEIYSLFNIQGLVRIDFIIHKDEPYFMEVNTIPGFSKASIVPQQIRVAGMKETDVISMLVEQAIGRKK